ncbi:hypothetical protein NECID01_1057 [Nematocida sp. AWRm77]|nr:hypothetical protein NECID01_1057 [Nematocida sp. AWRm77]
MKYLKRALCLQALQKPGEEKQYSWKGVSTNMLSLSLLMIANSSVYRTVSSMWSRENKEKICVYLSISARFVLFWIVEAWASFLYQKLYQFTAQESHYVVLYSISAMFPLLIIGKVLFFLVSELSEASVLVGTLYFLSAVLSTIFVFANTSRRRHSLPKKIFMYVCCLASQHALAVLSAIWPKELIDVLSFFVPIKGFVW